MVLASRTSRERRLEMALANLKGCDVVICDCSPTVNLININAIVYADQVIIPVSMDYLAQAGARQTMQIIDEINASSTNKTTILGILPTFFDARTRLSNDVLSPCASASTDSCSLRDRSNTSLRRRQLSRPFSVLPSRADLTTPATEEAQAVRPRKRAWGATRSRTKNERVRYRIGWSGQVALAPDARGVPVR
jgi:chromosome partitioning protein